MHYCPICNIELISCANPALFMCPTKRTSIISGNEVIYFDCAIAFNVYDQICWQEYMIFPYKLTINSHTSSDQKTVIEKIYYVSDFEFANLGYGSNVRFSYITEINEAVKFPWHDKEKVLNKIKNLLVFS